LKSNHSQRSTKVWDDFWRNHEASEWDSISQLVFNVLLKEIFDFKNKKILEAGSGSGRISLKVAEKGAKVFLLDYSESAVTLSKRNSSKKKIKSEIVRASIFNIPFKENVFDIVWNAGVLEHFSEEKQIKALEEMRAVCKKKGKIITMNPYVRAYFYRLGKWYAKRTGKWEVGYEKPIKTLGKKLEDLDIKIKNEYNTGFMESVDFLGYIPYTTYLTPIIRKLKKIFTSLGVGGYLLITVGEKK